MNEPPGPDDLAKAASSALQRGDWTFVVREAKRALVLRPGLVPAQQLLFKGLIGMQRVDEARVLGRDLVRRGNATNDILIETATLELEYGDVNLAIELLQLGDLADRATAALLAEAFERIGQVGSATAVRMAFLGSVQFVGDSSTPAREYFARQLMGLLSGCDRTADEVIELLGDGRYAEAKPAFQRWVGTAVDEEFASLAIVDWLLMSGCLDEAAEILDHVVTSCRYAGQLANRQGDVAHLKGNLLQARSHYRRATVIDRSDFNAWLDLARVEFLLGHKEAASAACQVVALESQSADLRSIAESFALEMSQSDQRDLTVGLYGLVAWEKGGGILQIQVKIRDRPGLLVTGNTGRLLEDATRVAYEVACSRHTDLRERGIHVHYPKMSEPKDGGSAGILLATMMIASCEGIHPSRRVAITGEIDLAEKALAIGGVREKLVAAHLHGMDTVFLPADNRADLLYVPESVKRSYEIVAYDSLGALLEALPQ